MECPYCGIEMERGHISAPRSAWWIKEGREAFIFRRSKGDVQAAEVWSRYTSDNSYLCRGCGKIIIDIPTGGGNLKFHA